MSAEQSTNPDYIRWEARYAAMDSPAIPLPHFFAPLSAEWLKNLPQPRRLLDAACGLGHGIATFSPWVEEIVAVDVSPAAIKLATGLWARKTKMSVQWQVSTLETVHWSPNFFDVICAFGYTDSAFMRRAAKWIKPGGLMAYQGFSIRQLEEKPSLNPAWVMDKATLLQLFPHWTCLHCSETPEKPYQIRALFKKPE